MPSGLQSVVFSLSNVAIQAGHQRIRHARYGRFWRRRRTTSIATYFFVSAFSQAAVTFIGQNFAAGKLKRCDTVFRLLHGRGRVCAVVLSVLFVAAGNLALGARTTDAAAMAFGSCACGTWTLECSCPQVTK